MKSYYLYNVHGDVSLLTDGAKNILQSYQYDAFGNQENPSDTDLNPFRYCGEYFDSETGDIYLRARYYDSGVGRFNTMDPAMDGLNWYAYCEDNPVNFVDRLGLKTEKLTNLVESLGGTVTWDNEKKEATVTINGKTKVYKDGDGKSTLNADQGKMYVDGDSFASDFGGSYNELSGVGYTGFEVTIPINRGAIQGSCITIDDTADGERYANQRNQDQNIRVNGFLFIVDIAVGVATGGASKGVQTVVQIIGAVVGVHSLFADYSYQLTAGETITTTKTMSYAGMGRAGASFTTKIYDANGKKRYEKTERY